MRFEHLFFIIHENVLPPKVTARQGKFAETARLFSSPDQRGGLLANRKFVVALLTDDLTCGQQSRRNPDFLGGDALAKRERFILLDLIDFIEVFDHQQGGDQTAFAFNFLGQQTDQVPPLVERFRCNAPIQFVGLWVAQGGQPKSPRRRNKPR